MSEKSIKKRAKPARLFSENPYELETIFESLSIASSNNKELIYVDRLISEIRSNPQGDITNINFKILQELKLINIPM